MKQSQSEFFARKENVENSEITLGLVRVTLNLHNNTLSRYH